ncbi:hypothetical protein L2E82_22565 [Cichorium intybus]|uniref:Uncharacterized protein n=1 Tax=Cichorium intybus TaxID=13427 RepID=A0ACB9DXQ2_CICIN|nr:hypothetical protein L2E82_22565 [Cichorium intybus]
MSSKSYATKSLHVTSYDSEIENNEELICHRFLQADPTIDLHNQLLHVSDEDENNVDDPVGKVENEGNEEINHRLTDLVQFSSSIAWFTGIFDLPHSSDIDLKKERDRDRGIKKEKQREIETDGSMQMNRDSWIETNV